MYLGSPHFFFQARTDSLEVKKKRTKWGEEKDTCEKCEIKRERNTETSEHVLIESPWYKEERTNLETEVIRSIRNSEWEEIKQSEDKRMKKILGLGDYEQKMMDITKNYLNTIWKKRKLNNMGQKHNRAGKQNTENFETGEYEDHNYYKILRGY